MPYAKFGEKTNLDGGSSNVFKLTTNGQQVTIRIVGDGFYNGKHFLQRDDGSWNIFFCPRVMKKSKCVYCEKSFEARKKLKEYSEAEKNEVNAERKIELQKEIKNLEGIIKRFSSTVRWYYPAINRDDKKPIIFEAALSIRNKLEEFLSAGENILASDFVIKRVEKPGEGYYSVVRKDSKATPELDEVEVEASVVALGWDLETEVQGNESSLEFAGESEEKKPEVKDSGMEGVEKLFNQNKPIEIDVDEVDRGIEEAKRKK